nr:RNA-directed DNA polymerase, eukaryota [Tanacetum cinerariifolium]
MWIQSCLYSFRGSVLVNESPTMEFQFHKGLKHDDPFSLFLFILVIESLHVSFQRVVDARLFNGINLDSSSQISHLFYVDNAIIMGQWSQCNIDTIIRVLNVFYHASGLRINMNKSNLMGISMDSNKVKHAAAKIALHGEDEKIGKKVQHSLVWGYCVKNLVPRLYALESMKDIDVASKLSHGGLEFSFRRNPRGGMEQAQFERLKEIIEGVTLSNSNDRWSWPLVGFGDFSVSSVRKRIDNAILSKGISKTRWIKE